MARRPPHRRRFIPGETITSLDALMLEAWVPTGRWVYWGCHVRPFHPRVVASWQFNMVSSLVLRGALRWAEPNPDYRQGNEKPRMWTGRRPRVSAFGTVR